MKNGQFKIEHNVPLPGGPAARGNKYPVVQMKVGDSFVVPKGKVFNDLYGYARKARVKVTVRKQEDGSNRVWRVK